MENKVCLNCCSIFDGEDEGRNCPECGYNEVVYVHEMIDMANAYRSILQERIEDDIQ